MKTGMLTTWQEAVSSHVITAEHTASVTPTGRLLMDIPDEVAVLAVIEAVCEVFDVAGESLVGSSRLGPLVGARRAVCVILDDLGYSAAKICKAIGRDRTSVYHLLKTGRDLIDTDQEFRGKYLKTCRLLRLA